MTELTIKTNRHWREFVYRCDVPPEVLADRFDHLDEDYSDEFFCYRGWWYHTSDFMACADSRPSPLAGWDGYAGDSFFSGVVIKIADDGERYMIGTYTC